MHGLLAQGKNAVCEVPPDRWILDQWWEPDVGVPNQMYTRHGGFLAANVPESFDATFFGVSKSSVQIMSSSQRLTLEHTAKVLCGANQSIAAVRGQDWEHLECNKSSSSPYVTTGISASVLAG